MKFARAVILLATLFIAACASVAPPAPADDVRISLTRTRCFGFCPDYTVTIASDGEVTYEGRGFVAVTGVQHAQIPREDVSRLLARFDAIGFTSLRDEYSARATDLPTYTLSLTRNGRTKSVRDYGGAMAGMPEAVRALQDEVDRVADTARWVTRNGEPVRDPPKN